VLVDHLRVTEVIAVATRDCFSMEARNLREPDVLTYYT